jgi:methyl acetate hydrolase
VGLKDAIDALLKRAVDAGDVPAVAAMVTDRDGTLYEGAFGTRVLGEDAPMRVDTVAWVASMTKALTGACAMQFVERGKLALDRPASDWLPALGEVQVLEGFDAAGKPRLRAPKSAITLRQLLTHTAGFGYDTWSAEVARYLEATGTPPMSTGRNAALGTPLLFDPGERWLYSIAIDWVGKAIEAVSGKRLGEAMAENLFDPLGLSSTAFKITPAMRARLAKVHQRDAAGVLAPIDLEIPQAPEFQSGGGGLYTTAQDYLAFLRMILNRGKCGSTQLLKPETVDLMARNAMGEIRVTPLKTTNPARSLDAEFFPGVPKSWGLTFQINQAPAPTGRPAGGLMWGGLSNCYFWIDMRNGIAGVYITQILPFVDTKALPLYYAFETAVYKSRS